MRLVQKTGKSIAQVARHLGINEGILGNWVNAASSGCQRLRSGLRYRARPLSVPFGMNSGE